MKTEGYIEMRKTIDIAGRPGGDHVFIVDRQSDRYIDCRNLALPFGPQFVEDIVNRTHAAQDQAAALLATETGSEGAEERADAAAHALRSRYLSRHVERAGSALRTIARA